MVQYPKFSCDFDQVKEFILATQLCQRAITANLPGCTPKIIENIIEAINTLSLSCHLAEFTDHGLPHIASLIKRADEWTLKNGETLSSVLSPYEAALLAISILIHDIGMLSQNPLDLEGDSGKGMVDVASWVRKTHCARIPRLLERLLKERFPDFVGTAFFQLACRVAMAHEEWAWQDGCKHYPVIQEISPQIPPAYGGPLDAKRISALAAIVAVCDLLDEDTKRCDTITLILNRQGTPLNLAHWIRHLLTSKPILIEKGQFQVEFTWLKYEKDPIGIDVDNDPSGCAEASRYRQVINALKNQFSSALLYNDELSAIHAELREPQYSEAKEPQHKPMPWNLPALKPFWGVAPERLLSSIFGFAREPNEQIQKKWATLPGSAKFQPLDLTLYHKFLGFSVEPLLEEEIIFNNILRTGL